MITFLQATAILSILMAFGVDQPTIDNVRNILIPPVVNVAPVQITPVQVIQTPVVQDAPIYFGSTQPVVYTPPKASPPVVQSTPMPNWTIKVISEDATTGKKDVPFTIKAGTGMLKLWLQVYNKDGLFEKVPVTVTTNDPDMPSTWVMNRPWVPGAIEFQDFFYVAVPDGSFHSVTVGTFDFTFTVEDVSKTIQVTVTP